MSYINIHIEVILNTDYGQNKVVNDDPVSVQVDDDNKWFPSCGYLGYKDIRAFKLKIYAEQSIGEYGCVGEYKLKQSDTYNLSYVSFDQPIDLFNVVNNDSLTNESQKGLLQKNRVLVSEVGEPAVFDAARTYYIGQNNEDQIRGFAVNALPISQGQFGQYPLYIFTYNTTWALEQSSDPSITFGRLSPVNQHRGAMSERSITNIGRAVCVGDENGIYILGSDGFNEVGRPINKLINGDFTLAYYKQGNHDEIWISCDDNIFIYNLYYSRWYGLDRGGINHFFYKSGNLYSLLENGNIWNESDIIGSSSSAIEISITFCPIHYGAPDQLKRLFWAALRSQLKQLDSFSLTFERTEKTIGGTAKSIRPRHPSDFSYTVHIEATMDPESNQYIESIDTEYEPRYQNIRQHQTTHQQ